MGSSRERARSSSSSRATRSAARSRRAKRNAGADYSWGPRAQRPLKPGEYRGKPDRFVPLDPSKIGEGGEQAWRGGAHVSPETRAQIAALANEYEQLSNAIDAAYASGQHAGVEALEERAEYLAETIESRLIELSETQEERQGHGVEELPGLEEELARVWWSRHHDPLYYAGTHAEFLESLRGIVHERLRSYGVVPDLSAVDDETLLQAAEDAYNRRQGLRARYKAAPGRGPTGPELADRAKRKKGKKNPEKPLPTSFTIRVTESNAIDNWWKVEGYSSRDGSRMGYVWFVVEPRFGIARVVAAQTEDPWKRRGLATALYQRAAEYAAYLGYPLASDTARSDRAEAFWKKQHAKGRTTFRQDPSLPGFRSHFPGEGYRYVLNDMPPETLANPGREP